MIRRENRAVVEHTVVGLFTKTPVIWVSLGPGRAGATRLEEATCRQREIPVLVRSGRWNSRGREYWLYDDVVYSTDVHLTAEQVRDLVIERALKENARLARASAAAQRAAVTPRPRRAPIPPDIKSLVWQRDGGQCVSCGSTVRLEFDHVIPVSMGGADTVRNLQLLCVSCNAAKGGDLT
jgi:5-methylcytosine-specific restriction endonuclease McrA